MASIEYTEVFSFTGIATGLQTVNCTLGSTIPGGAPPSGSAFVIKYLNVSSSTGFQDTPYTATLSAGSRPIATVSDEAIAANEPLELINDAVINNTANVSPYAQVIVTVPQLIVGVNMTGTGTVYVIVTYLLISQANPLYQNFVATGNSNQAQGNITLLNATTKTILIKSLLISTLDTNNTNTYTFHTFLDNGSNTPQLGAYTGNMPMSGYETLSFRQPLYLYANDPYALKLNFALTGSNPQWSWYLSYTVDNQA